MKLHCFKPVNLWQLVLAASVSQGRVSSSGTRPFGESASPAAGPRSLHACPAGVQGRQSTPRASSVPTGKGRCCFSNAFVQNPTCVRRVRTQAVSQALRGRDTPGAPSTQGPWVPLTPWSSLLPPPHPPPSPRLPPPLSCARSAPCSSQQSVALAAILWSQGE